MALELGSRGREKISATREPHLTRSSSTDLFGQQDDI